jgi:ligand-binding sensor domain-containing protein/signal transduction histidine kinase
MLLLPNGTRLTSVLASAAVILAFAALPSPRLSAQEENSDKNGYLIDVWQTQQGLPEDLVTSILQTRDGYLWIGTFGGLARFDGVRFVTFNMQNSPAFRHDRIWGMYESQAGDLWIGSDGGGMTRYHEGQFINYGVQQGLSSDSVDCIGEDDEGGIWIKNLFASSLSRWQDGKITVHPGRDLPANLKNPWGFQTNDSGQVWIANGKTLKCRLPGKLSQLGGYSSVWQDRKGNLWVYGSRFAAQLQTDGRPGQEARAEPCLEANVGCLLEGKEGDFWVGTSSKGLFHWREGQGSNFEKIKGISDVEIRTIYEDREGTIWIGTTGGGLIELRPRIVDLHSDGELRGKDILTVVEDQGKRLWVGTFSDGVFYSDFETDHYKRFHPLSGPFNKFNIWSLCSARDGTLWVGTWGGGLFKVKDGQVAQFTSRNGLSDDSIMSLYEDQDGILWIGTYLDGLDRFDGKSFTTYGPKEGLTGKFLTSILRGRDGTLWVGSNGEGVFRMVQGRFTNYSMKDGLANSLVMALREDSEGYIWVGTHGGLSRWDRGHFVSFTRESGLPADVIKEVLEDNFGNFWLGSDQGIIRVSKQELNAMADGKIAWLHTVLYGQKDGLSNVECRGSSQPAVCKTHDGQLWFATHVGLATIDPYRVYSSASTAPTVVIEDVAVNGHHLKSLDRTAPLQSVPGSVPLGSNIELLPSQRAFQIRYTVLSLAAPEKVQFKYRMEGLDEDWIEAGLGRVAAFQYLPPGNYQFQVVACNDHGIWSKTPSTLAIRLLPSFWETRWFLGLAISAVALATGASVRLVTKRRMQQKLERLERQQALALERARIARDIHDEVGASLTKISKLAESLNQRKEATEEGNSSVRNIADTADKTIQSMDEIVWAINPENDTLQHIADYLVHVTKEFLQPTTIRCQIDVPVTLSEIPVPSLVRHNVLMVVKEALNNAVKHAAPHCIRLNLECLQNVLAIEVADDGKGFNPGSTSVFGNGLGIMQKRLKSVGGELQLKSEPGRGTTVRVKVRLDPQNGN